MIPIEDKEKQGAAAAETAEEPVKADAEAAKKPEAPADDAKSAKQDTAVKSPEELLAASEKEKAVLNDRYLRICAEYDNFRKRSQREKEAIYSDLRTEVLQSFLPVYDNLVRALATATQDEAYRKGVEMIMNQFNTTLDKLGVTEIPALGQKFDPTRHNAIMHVEDETKGENEIVEVFQKGFQAGDKIIRFAMVKVAN